jgi:uncharacterized protein YdhG (YjbR/CyaY superfamily)
MARMDFKSVDDYIAAQPPAARAILRRVRSTLRTALPKAEEVISYQIPAYRQPGGIVIFFAGWTQHYSLYPITQPLRTTFGDELAPYAASKGTLRFPLDQPVPVTLIKRIAKFRAKEVAEQEKTKASRRKKR